MTNIINIFKNKSRYTNTIFQKVKKILQKEGYQISTSYNKYKKLTKSLQIELIN